jgi:hypothetical protein
MYISVYQRQKYITPFETLIWFPFHAGLRFTYVKKLSCLLINKVINSCFIHHGTPILILTFVILSTLLISVSSRKFCWWFFIVTFPHLQTWPRHCEGKIKTRQFFDYIFSYLRFKTHGFTARTPRLRGFSFYIPEIFSDKIGFRSIQIPF